MSQSSDSEGPREEKAATVQTRSKPKKQDQPLDELPKWKVLLHNDDVNEFDYVIETVSALTPLGLSEAATRTIEAHETGLSLLLMTHQERAELYVDQFKSRKLVVTIEPEEGT